MCTYTDMQICEYACMCIGVCVHMYVHTYTYIRDLPCHMYITMAYLSLALHTGVHMNNASVPQTCWLSFVQQLHHIRISC